MNRSIKSLCILFFCITISLKAWADVVLDGTISPWWGAIPGPDHDIYNDYGHQVGSNLFHSFSQFNISAGQSATFKVWTPPPAPIANIIARVTGANYSWINGPLRSEIPGANLYLLNPNGIFFGSNASLDISGSFHASTADYLALGSGGIFYTNPDFDASNVLTTSSPEAFGFLADNIAEISVASWVENGLEVPNGKTLSLIAGNINIYEGELYAPFGRINLVSRASAGEVTLSPEGIYLTPGSLGTLAVTEFAHISVDGSGGGNIHIRSGQFELSNSTISSQGKDNNSGRIDIAVQHELIINQGGIFSKTEGDGLGSDIQVEANKISLTGDEAYITTESGGSGNAGKLTINTKSLDLQDSATISTNTYASGQGGDLLLQANNIALTGDSRIITTNSSGSGDAGNLTIETTNLSIQDAAQISTYTFSSGQGGRLFVEADNIFLDNGHIIALTGFNSSGNAGDLSLNTHNLEAWNKSHISTTTFSSGQGADLQINADTILLTDSYIHAATFSSGNAGNLMIRTDKLIAQDRAIISASTYSSGQGGNLQIDANNILAGNGSSIAVLAAVDSSGNAGNLTINSHSLDIQSNAEISASTYDSGHGGHIDVQVTKLQMENSDIRAESTDTGDAGSITVEARDAIHMINSSISTETRQSDGGNITVNAINMLYLLNSEITTSAQGGAGAGGNISIDPIHVILNNSNITANAFGGSGGNINIVADNFFQSPDSVITASSQLGIDGSVQVDSPDTNISGSLSVLSGGFLDASRLLQNRCTARNGMGTSSLVMAGRGGIPLPPDGLMSASLLDLASMQTDKLVRPLGDLYLPANFRSKNAPWVACL